MIKIYQIYIPTDEWDEFHSEGIIKMWGSIPQSSEELWQATTDYLKILEEYCTITFDRDEWEMEEDCIACSCGNERWLLEED